MNPSGSLTFQPSYGGSSVSATSNVSNWTLITVAYDGLDLRIYFNKDHQGNLYSSGSFRANSEPLLIGKKNQWGGFWKGLVDDVRIYNRVLFGNEVEALYNEGSGCI